MTEEYILFSQAEPPYLEMIQKLFSLRVPIVAQWLTNPTRNHEVAGSIPGLAQTYTREL